MKNLIGIAIGHKSDVGAVRERLRSFTSPQQASILFRFCKTGPGQCGEGEQFMGVRAFEDEALE